MSVLAGCAKSDASARPAATPATAGTAKATSRTAPTDSMAIAATPADSALRAAADAGRITGADSAPVWLLVVSDFECPYCRQWHLESHAVVLRDYVAAGKIRLAYVNFPLPSHTHALPAAEAAMCASAQGKFTPYADKLFETQPQWHEMGSAPAQELFADLAKEVGLDVATWNTCTSSGAMRPLVLADRERARQANVGSTPTFLLGQTRIPGVMPLGAFRQAIDDELARARAAKGDSTRTR